MTSVVIPVTLSPKDQLLQAFSSSLPLPSGTEPQLLGALCQVLQFPGSLIRAQLVYHRPNVALAIGPAKALLRLERLMHLGDQVLDRLTRRRPSLRFMDEIRRRFRDEIATLQVTEPARSL
jgi:hypothetical protein